MPRDVGSLTLYQFRMLVCPEEHLKSHRTGTEGDIRKWREKRKKKRQEEKAAKEAAEKAKAATEGP
jgi:hypothetical protein